MIPPVPPAYMPLAIVGVAMFGLAAWLIVLDPASPLNRAFSLLLTLRGATTLAIVGIHAWDGVDDQVVRAFATWGAYLVIPVTGVMVYFLSVYPRRRGLGSKPWGWAVLTLATVAAMTWYAIDHTTWKRVVATPDGSQVVDGPLFLFASLVKPMFALAAYVLARDYRLQPKGSKGYSTFMIAAAFAINALVDGMSFLVPFVHELWLGGFEAVQNSYFSSSVTLSLFAIASLPIGAMAVVEMMRAIRHESEDATLQEARRFIVVIVPIALATSIIASIFAIRGQQIVFDFIFGFWRLVYPAMIAYALLRFSLFNADIRLKAGVRRAIVMVAFTVTFFIVSEAAEALLQGDRGAIVGIVGAALIALAARPMHVMAQRAADALMPDTRPVSEMSPLDRQMLYHEQYTLVEQDRVLTSKERRMLDNLAASLGLGDEEAASLETSEPSFTTDDTRAAPAAAPEQHISLGRRVLAAGLTALAFGAVAQSLELLVPASDAVGLLAAALIALLLGPIEALAGRLTGAHDVSTPDPETLELYRAAVDDVVADGDLSRRDRIYLRGLAERLGIDRPTRRFVDSIALQENGLRPRRALRA